MQLYTMYATSYLESEGKVNVYLRKIVVKYNLQQSLSAKLKSPIQYDHRRKVMLVFIFFDKKRDKQKLSNWVNLAMHFNALAVGAG